MKRPWTLLLAAASTYMASTLLECTSMIQPNHHNTVRATTFCYGLFFALCSVYTLVGVTVADDPEQVPHTKVVWWVSAHAGAVVFALLGEVPWLENFALTPGWWGRLPLEGKLTVCLLCAGLVALGVRQCAEAWKRRLCLAKATGYALFVGAYLAVYACLASVGAQTVWHVHHAIAAGFLSLCFGDWASNIDVVVHGACIGVLVEGIAFYGIDECMLFIVHHDARVGPASVLLAWGVVVAGGFVLFTLLRFRCCGAKNDADTKGHSVLLDHI